MKNKYYILLICFFACFNSFLADAIEISTVLTDEAIERHLAEQKQRAYERDCIGILAEKGHEIAERFKVLGEKSREVVKSDPKIGQLAEQIGEGITGSPEENFNRIVKLARFTSKLEEFKKSLADNLRHFAEEHKKLTALGEMDLYVAVASELGHMVDQKEKVRWLNEDADLRKLADCKSISAHFEETQKSIDVLEKLFAELESVYNELGLEAVGEVMGELLL